MKRLIVFDKAKASVEKIQMLEKYTERPWDERFLLLELEEDQAKRFILENLEHMPELATTEVGKQLLGSPS